MVEPVKAECERHDIILVMVWTFVVVDILSGQPLPLGSARALHTRCHAFSVQRLSLAEVH